MKLTTLKMEPKAKRPWRASDHARALIMSAEGLRLVAYPDVGGRPTIGYGHTAGVRLGTAIDDSHAEDLLEDDIAKCERCLARAVTVPLTQGMVDALIDWIFNLGCAEFRGSEALRLLNLSNYRAAWDRFQRYDRAGNQRLPGLIHRRMAETELFYDNPPT